MQPLLHRPDVLDQRAQQPGAMTWRISRWTRTGRSPSTSTRWASPA